MPPSFKLSSSFFFQVGYFIDNCGDIKRETTNITKEQLEDEFKYAEDLVIAICQECGICPIARHLFSLFSPETNLWLASNQDLKELDSRFKILELRIRFKPYNVKALITLDYNCFNYYFCQLRDAFRRAEIKDKSRLFGLVIVNLFIYALAKQIDPEKALDRINSLEDFIPIKHKEEFKIVKKYKSKNILKELSAINEKTKIDSDGLTQIDFVKMVFINDIVDYDETIIENYGYETYFAKLLNDKSQSIEYQLQFRPFKSLSLFHSPLDKVPVWVEVCSVADITFILVQDQTIEISRKNGIPWFLGIKDIFAMKSLLSLLEGYHRLSTGDSLCICEYVMPPSFETWKIIRCHGPIGFSNSEMKLKERSQNIIGTYLIRQNEKRYEYIIDVLVGVNKIKSYPVIPKDGQLLLETDDGSRLPFGSFTEIKQKFKVMIDQDGMPINLKACIPPIGNNIFSWGVLCKSPTPPKPVDALKQPNYAGLFPNFAPYLREGECRKDGSFRTYLIVYQGKKMVCKEPAHYSLRRFLAQLRSWSELQSTLVTKTRFIGLEPTLFVRDYLPMGPLDQYLRDHRDDIQRNELIECAAYLARTLYYLYENNVVHGRIRCKALLVVERSNQKFQIQLSDPFFHVNENDDRAWIPKEYSAEYSSEIPPSVDIYATGTTLWEIFSYGKHPTGPDVHKLDQPASCPSQIWKIIEKCWIAEPEHRIHPVEIYRDIRKYFLTRRQNPAITSTYTYPANGSVTSKRKSNSINLSTVIYKYWTAYRSLSSKYDYQLANEDDYESMMDAVDGENKELWVIKLKDLSIVKENGEDKILGRGNYGVVVLAKYRGYSDRFVAVKRINAKTLAKSGGKSPQIISDMEREFEIMTQLDHPNIVEVIGIVRDPEIMLVMEFLELGSLTKFLRERRNAVHEFHKIPFTKYALDIVKGMEYLESKKIVHRDLAARNILMASIGTVKISDFGLAQHLGPDEDTYKVKTLRYLPFIWYAPESIQHSPIFTHKSDVWSFGVTLWEIFTLADTPTYPMKNLKNQLGLRDFLLSGGRLPKPSKNIPNTEIIWNQIIVKCWETLDTSRPSFSDLRQEIELIVNSKE